MNVEESVLFLELLGANKVPHGRRTLLQHLVGTRDLLRIWNCEDDVCVAGLFHSVYGTTIFKHTILHWDRRCELKTLIGTKAERLSYLFAVARRPRDFLQGLSRKEPLEIGEHLRAQASYEEILRLVEIECANLVEQTFDKAAEDSISRILAIRDAARSDCFISAYKNLIETQRKLAQHMSKR